MNLLTFRPTGFEYSKCEKVVKTRKNVFEKVSSLLSDELGCFRGGYECYHSGAVDSALLCNVKVPGSNPRVVPAFHT